MHKIGILGGTFDPVHFGHLRIGLECKEALGLDELRVIPCAVPPHRDSPHANAEQRTAMLSTALADTDEFVIDDRELRRTGYSYTVDTLTALKAEFPEAAFYLIIGSDSFQSLPRWHNWKSILALSNIVVAQRPDHGDDMASETGIKLKSRFCSVDEIKQSISEKITFVGVSQLGISATDIRERIKKNKSVKYLLPDSVITYIKNQALYKRC